MSFHAGSESDMDPAKWTPTEAAYHLSEAYAASIGVDGADPNFTALHALALAMEADTDYMEEGWTTKQVEDARYWLDVTTLDELSTDSPTV